jgi:hypothetical protein
VATWYSQHVHPRVDVVVVSEIPMRHAAALARASAAGGGGDVGSGGGEVGSGGGEVGTAARIKAVTMADYLAEFHPKHPTATELLHSLMLAAEVGWLPAAIHPPHDHGHTPTSTVTVTPTPTTTRAPAHTHIHIHTCTHAQKHTHTRSHMPDPPPPPPPPPPAATDAHGGCLDRPMCCCAPPLGQCARGGGSTGAGWRRRGGQRGHGLP